MTTGQQMQEKEVFDDVLTSQKFITETYNTFANECATPNIRSEFMRILTEEHQIQADVFDEMQKRGWYQTPAAEQQKIQQAKQKFQNQNPNQQ
jgi:spore coat protein CotF